MGSIISFFKRRGKDQLILGRTGPYSIFPKFSVSPQVRKFHTYVVGLTGRGKSKFLQNCLLQDIQSGRGCAIIDPHGDLAKDTLRSLIASGWFDTPGNADRIVYVAPRRRDFIIPFNVLTRPDPETETYEVCQRVISSFMRTWARTLLEPPRFQQVMRASLAALVETGGTLCQLYQLLTDENFRTTTLQNIPDPKVQTDCLSFFTNEFEQWGRDRAKIMASTTNKVSAMTDNPNIFYMLGQKENKLNIRSIMDEGKVLIADLGDCDDETKRLFGTLLVTGFEQAALSRARAPMDKRKTYYLYIDEFQDFACHPGAAETFSQMLSQVRKFGLHLILANQSIAQLSPGLQTALGNAQTIVSFRISRADAEALSKVLGEVDPQVIKRANSYAAQHPLYSPLNEQWEGFIQHLTNQKVRQATVKTADDRLSVIWAEKLNEQACPQERLDQILTQLVRRHGYSFNSVYKKLVKISVETSSKAIYDF
jgi:hypothetical protein